MKFDELDAKMRVFETAHDYFVLTGIYMFARIETDVELPMKDEHGLFIK